MSDDDRCRACGKRIKYKAGARRRLYCDERCRQKAYRARQRPAHTERRIAERMARWRRKGYPDSLIEQLMALGNVYGDQAADAVESILMVHELVVIQQVRERDAKRNEA